MKKSSIKIRCFPESNYKAVWVSGKTIRFQIDSTLPITELEFPEFYDVKITGYCEGKCPWCYMDSKECDPHYDNIVEKINKTFKPMTENQRPFQVAIGGGEPTTHPEFVDSLEAFNNLGIVPNYTTNGMWVNLESQTNELTEKEKIIIKGTKQYCGGVAVSCHPHLKDYWKTASILYLDNQIRLNFHLIISDKDSINEFMDIYEQWKNRVEYFVLLPYGIQGRAEEKNIDWDYLISVLPEDTSQIAFGANFYSYLQKGGHNIKVSLYEPEIMSSFITFEGGIKYYPSSFKIDKEIIK